MENKVQITFSTLILSFSSLTLVNLGLIPEPQTKKIQKNLEIAKQNIDILNMIEEKTKGNLTKDETELLTNMLRELRLEYVKAQGK